MARQRATLDPSHIDAVASLAQRVLSQRGLLAIYTLEMSAALARIRREAADLLTAGASPSAIAVFLQEEHGVIVGESTIRSWAASASVATRAIPTWWHLVDHRNPSIITSELSKLLGMIIDSSHAPHYYVPATPEQAQRIKEEIPEMEIYSDDYK